MIKVLQTFRFKNVSWCCSGKPHCKVNSSCFLVCKSLVNKNKRSCLIEQTAASVRLYVTGISSFCIFLHSITERRRERESRRTWGTSVRGEQGPRHQREASGSRKTGKLLVVKKVNNPEPGGGFREQAEIQEHILQEPSCSDTTPIPQRSGESCWDSLPLYVCSSVGWFICQQENAKTGWKDGTRAKKEAIQCWGWSRNFF